MLSTATFKPAHGSHWPIFFALVSSIGVAGIPAASLVALIIIMQNAGFSEDAIKASLALILTVDRPLDMARTAVNVFGDTVGAVVIAKSEGERLEGPRRNRKPV